MHRAKIEVETFEVHESGCNGSFCDQQFLMMGDVMVGRCPYIQMNKTEKVAFQLCLNVTLENRRIFSDPVHE